MQRFRLSEEWLSQVVVGRDITHALTGRTLQGGDWYDGNSQRHHQPSLRRKWVEGVRDTPGDESGEGAFKTAIVVDDDNLAYEVKYEELGPAF